MFGIWSRTQALPSQVSSICAVILSVHIFQTSPFETHALSLSMGSQPTESLGRYMINLNSIGRGLHRPYPSSFVPTTGGGRKVRCAAISGMSMSSMFLSAMRLEKTPAGSSLKHRNVTAYDRRWRLFRQNCTTGTGSRNSHGDSRSSSSSSTQLESSSAGLSGKSEADGELEAPQLSSGTRVGELTETSRATEPSVKRPRPIASFDLAKLPADSNVPRSASDNAVGPSLDGSAQQQNRRLFWVQGALGVLNKLGKGMIEVPEDAADEGRFLMMAAFVGVLTGTAVTIFKRLIGAVKSAMYIDLIGRFPAGATTLVTLLIPVMGAVAVVSFLRLLRLKSYGPGLGGLTEEVDRQMRWNPIRTLGKTLAAVATLGTGNSLGPEGPAVELGVASSRCVSSLSNLSVERQRMLLGAGAAGGVAAGFNAPIAGIFFALEIVKDTFQTNYNSKSFIAGTLLCAVVSALIAKIGLHDELSLRPAAYNLESPLIELPLYLGLGIVAGLVAVMFKFFSRKSGDVFEGNFPGFRWMGKVPQWGKPIMMAFVTGLVGVFHPQVLFFGYETLDNLLANTGQYSLALLCFLCVAKALLTAGALGSGLVGGTFAPSLFLGATAGAAYQRVLLGSLTALRLTAGPSIARLSTFLLPVTSVLGIGGPTGDLDKVLNIAGSPAYAMVGAAAVLSALYRAPLTGSLLIFELTKDYEIVVPLMAAAGVSSLVVELFSRTENESEAKEASAAMPRDMSLEIGLKMPAETLMDNVQLADALVPRVLTLTADTSLEDAMRAFRLTRQEFAVVVNKSGNHRLRAPGECAAFAAESSIGGEGGQVQTLWAEDMWKRRDLELIGVLALREIVLALEKEKYKARLGGSGELASCLTAGSVCRTNCFTVQASTNMQSAKNVMGSKGVRFLPVVVNLESPPGPVTSVTRRSELLSASEELEGIEPVEYPAQAVVGILSRESLRIAGRLSETERAIREMSPPPPLDPLDDSTVKPSSAEEPPSVVALKH